MGPPGTGKSHVAKAIAYAAVRQVSLTGIMEPPMIGVLEPV
ncbi:MAG: AAA family ATPase [Dechloromonas sp.]|nr:AAA family ATPase [Dechloromonas sp.]